MKLQLGSSLLSVREWAQWIGGLVFIIIATIGFLAFMVKPQFAIIKKQKKELAGLNSKFTQYSNFKNSAAGLERKKDNIADVINYYETELKPNNLTEQNVLDELGRISAGRVKIDKLNANTLSTKINENTFSTNPAWTLHFSASFDLLTDFISLLERSFKIDGLKIQKGSKYPSLDIEMTVIPLDSGEKKQEVLATSNTYEDFMDIFDRISAISDNIGIKVKKLKNIIEIKKDPFSARAEKKKVKPDRPYIRIDGISWDRNESSSRVVIDGNIYSIGNTVHNAKILRINKNSIVVLWDSKEFTIK
ncbi:MAG: hypothetical protein LHV68_09020 [Elusimicrobia bacterium]|nr:hypothetical protein [Candidatus Liberimonas magnetica]